MNRRYGRTFYLDLIQRLKGEMPDFCLTLDVMAGFPGVEQDHFENTVDLLKKVNPLKCHVFPYSRREGTRAARFKDLPSSVIRDRVRQLLTLSDRLGEGIRRSYVGQGILVLVERVKPWGDQKGSDPLSNFAGSKAEAERGLTPLLGVRPPQHLLQGLSTNFMKVAFRGDPTLMGQIVPVELVGVRGDVLIGEAVVAEGF